MGRYDDSEESDERLVAYFTMEMGIDERIPTYSGGLGVLAGDMIKSCADLKVPVVAVTLLNRQGYFRQKLDKEGNQQEFAADWNVKDFMTLAPVKVPVEIEGKEVWVQAWEYTAIGASGYEIPIYFLDTNIPENSDYHRTLTNHLYGGDSVYRLCQEVILGIGGLRIIQALGHDNIRKYHMNEGHSSLLTLELLRQTDTDGKRNYDFEGVKEKCVFTTHTPVPSGHDRFPEGIVKSVLKDYSPIKFMNDIFVDGELNMTYLAMKHSGHINGVAKKHCEVSKCMFPGYRIDSITNGVHSATWVCEQFRKVYDTHIPGWAQDPFTLRYALGIPKEEIWDAHLEAKKTLISYVNKKAGSKLDSGVFTIGFARRATKYKRHELLFTDTKRLIEVCKNAGKLQIIYAGKAHPNDSEGKQIIKNIFKTAKELEGKIEMVYLEDYDMTVAKLLISGVDVWLNTPLRPMEASGTSGMKASHNGIPHFSILDGWWLEGHIENVTGWAIGPKPTNNDAEKESESKNDAKDLYDKLENAILPTFYRNPEDWQRIMRHSIAFNASFFNTHRMVQQYVMNAYFE